MKKIFKKILLMFLIMACMMSSLPILSTDTQATTIYTSLNSLPKNALDNFYVTLQNNTFVPLFKINNSYCVKLIVNGTFYYISEKAFISENTTAYDTFAKYNVSTTNALNSGKFNADHSYYMMQRTPLGCNEYRVRLTRLNETVEPCAASSITLTSTVTHSLTCTYSSSTHRIYIKNKTNNGLKVKPTFRLKETKADNYTYMNSISSDVRGVSTKAKTIDAGTCVSVLYKTYSIAKGVISGNLFSATLTGLGLIFEYNGTSNSSTNISFTSTNCSLMKNGKYVYSCTSTSPIYLSSVKDVYQVKIGFSNVLLSNNKMTCEFLITPSRTAVFTSAY